MCVGCDDGLMVIRFQLLVFPLMFVGVLDPSPDKRHGLQFLFVSRVVGYDDKGVWRMERGLFHFDVLVDVFAPLETMLTLKE
jgi:hypothetical protein